MHNWKIQFPLLCAILSFGLAHPGPAFNQHASGILVINPGSQARESMMKDWLMSFTDRFMYEWGRSRGLYLVDDRGPIVDNSAAYVGPYGSKILLEGLVRGERYRMWLDFVRFRSAKKSPPSVLKIFASCRGIKSRLIGTVRYSDIGDEYYALDIPMDITNHGKVEIIFEELAREPGLWGIWDIIVSNRQELPSMIGGAGESAVTGEARERIVQ